jgi:hypothetical protein
VSLKLTQRQLDALREDAIEEGRSKERQEQTARSMERSFKRTHVLPPQAPVFTTIGDLKLSTDDGRHFHHHAEIIEIQTVLDDGSTLRDGEIWAKFKLFDGGTGGSRLKVSDRVLILAGTGFVN